MYEKEVFSFSYVGKLAKRGLMMLSMLLLSSQHLARKTKQFLAFCFLLFGLDNGNQ